MSEMPPLNFLIFHSGKILQFLKSAAVLSGKLASTFVRVERDSQGTTARMDLLSFPK